MGTNKVPVVETTFCAHTMLLQVSVQLRSHQALYMAYMALEFGDH